MPIHINLLAETQVAEEMRRQDPVKRAIWAGVFAASLMLLWSAWLWSKWIIVRNEVNHLESGMQVHSKEYGQVKTNQQQLALATQKLSALQKLSATRFLYGNVLDALQRATVDNVQLIRFKAEQAYVSVPEGKPTTNGDRIVPGKPAATIEKITLTLEAKDSSPHPGDGIPQYRAMLASTPYFQAVLGKTNQIRLTGAPSSQNLPDGRTVVQFMLQCVYPEKTR